MFGTFKVVRELSFGQFGKTWEELRRTHVSLGSAQNAANAEAALTPGATFHVTNANKTMVYYSATRKGSVSC